MLQIALTDEPVLGRPCQGLSGHRRRQLKMLTIGIWNIVRSKITSRMKCPPPRVAAAAVTLITVAGETAALALMADWPELSKYPPGRARSTATEAACLLTSGLGD